MRRHLSPDGQPRNAGAGGLPARDNTRALLIGTVCVIVAAFMFLREPSHPPQKCPVPEKCATIGTLRAAALNAQNGHFVSDKFDAVTKEERMSATGQRGATLWMTGLSGSGKSTIGKELERRLIMEDGIHVYRLDGDNLRFGLSKDLKLTDEDRDEAVRRAGEVAMLMADSGTLTIVSLISPFAKARDAVRFEHQNRKLEFLELFVNASTSEVEARDPKGLYKLHREGKIKKMTGFDAPYEVPKNPELLLQTQECCGNTAVTAQMASCKAAAAASGKQYTKECPETVSACVDHCVSSLRQQLKDKGLVPEKKLGSAEAAKVVCPKAECPMCPAAGAAAVKEETKTKLPGAHGHADGYPAGTTPPSAVHDNEEFWRSDELTKMQPVPIRDVDVQWVQVIGEGWASPLKGPMREGALVQALHFNSMLVNTEGLGGDSLHGAGPKATDFGNSTQAAQLVSHGTRVSMPVPITIPVVEKTKKLIERAMANGAKDVVLVSPSGEPVAVLSNPELYAFRKEEMITRSWGAWDLDHPYIKENIVDAGDFLIGGELSRVRRIRFRDGLDKWRLTPEELIAEFKKRGADSVFAFQTRNPTHAGHAHLMEDGRRQLKENHGFKKPVLWLSPLGGWTKSDDVPLDVRVKQHEAVLQEKMLDPEETVLAIWPSPMVYSGPTEVQWHAKSRRVAGADYFIVGRDPAGLPYSAEYAKAHGQEKGEDVYHADHGRYVLQVSPGMGDLGLLASGAVHYDKTDGKMRPKPAGMSKEEFSKQFLKISGSAMRKMGKKMVDICPSLAEIPETWSKDPSCVPPGFMVKTGWDIMKKYYKTKDEPEVKENAVLQSKMRPALAENAEAVYPTKVGLKGNQYAVYLKDTNKARISPWHDVPLKEGSAEKVYNMVVEFPKGTNAKFEVQKDLPYNPIKQDTKNDLPRYYTYGLSFFNNGLFPQTWEDSSLKDEEGHNGDNDPLDVMEVGSLAYPIGSVVKVKVLGSLGMIDQGETDHKVIAIALDDPDAAKINDIASLREVKGSAFVDRIVDWLKNYKTTDKYPKEAKPNSFLNNGEYSSADEAAKIIEATHKRWELLREGKIEKTEATKDFWLGK